MSNQYLYDKFNNLEHRQLHTALEMACTNGSLNEVRYILTSPEIKIRIDINVHNNNPLFLACQSGNLHIVKYLLTSPELKKHADIYSRKSRCFRAICNAQHLDIVEYLIRDYKIEKNENMENYLNNKKTVFCNHVKHLFEMRALNSSLHNELNSEHLNDRKLKI